VLAGCTAEPAPDAPDWIGQSRSELVKALGEPTETIKIVGGGQILAYEEKETLSMPAPSHLSGSGYQQSGAFLEPERKVMVSCVREYEISKSGAIVGIRTRKGTGCLD
jgi:hypothetical protein